MSLYILDIMSVLHQLSISINKSTLFLIFPIFMLVNNLCFGLLVIFAQTFSPVRNSNNKASYPLHNLT